ncbi:MAG: hypothetical protein SFV81_12265 [Pirellulaceae bacterium]|nr:hypothetical protein [Pirellulaceae bacterium]
MLTQSMKPTRGQALEEAFFFRMDQELIEQLSRRLQREEKIRLFASATGIRDRKHLEMLADSGFELSTLTAFIWVPLLFVAWADGSADDMEKGVISEVLATKGISKSTTSMMLEHEWFRKRPTEELWQVWAEFSTATLQTLDAEVRDKLIKEMIGLCRVVAHASGGVMGLGKISASEAKVIDRVTRTLERCEERQPALSA